MSDQYADQDRDTEFQDEDGEVPEMFRGKEDHEPQFLMHLESVAMDMESVPEDVVEKAPIWLVTFGDVTALMLAFFVMLFSMSHLQSEEWDAIISILATREQPVSEGDPRPVGERTVSRIDLVAALPVGYLERILREKLAAEPELSNIRITGLDEQIVLSLFTDDIFGGDATTLSPRGERVISRLSVVFRQFGNSMLIRGHTDPDPPPRSLGFDDNWDLSLARALTVARALNEAGYGGNFTVLGLGDSAYRHLDRNYSEPRRYQLARRVDIVILPEASGQ